MPIPVHPRPSSHINPGSQAPVRPQQGHAPATQNSAPLQACGTAPVCTQPQGGAPSATLLVESPGESSWWNEGGGQAAHPILSSLRSKMVFLLSLPSGKHLQLSPQSNSCSGQYFESEPQNVQEVAVSNSRVRQHNSLQASATHSKQNFFTAFNNCLSSFTPVELTLLPALPEFVSQLELIRTPHAELT